jgi:hypothetical protein
LIARLLLLLSAYSPLVILIGVRDHNSAQSWSLIGLGALLTLGLPCVIVLAGRLTQPFPAVVVSAQDAAQEVTGYLTSFILPFAMMSALTGRDFIALGLFGVLLAIAYLQSERLALNPWLYFARRRILELDLGNGAELLITHRVPSEGDELTLTRLSRGLYYLPRSGRSS